jgi:hypothetical protein
MADYFDPQLNTLDPNYFNGQSFNTRDDFRRALEKYRNSLNKTITIGQTPTTATVKSFNWDKWQPFKGPGQFTQSTISATGGTPITKVKGPNQGVSDYDIWNSVSNRPALKPKSSFLPNRQSSYMNYLRGSVY